MSEFILIGRMKVFKSKFDVELIVLFKRLFNEHFNFSLNCYSKESKALNLSASHKHEVRDKKMRKFVA